MCSIGGFVSSVPLDPILSRRLCTALLWYGSDRGIQSSGCYINSKLAKAAVTPYDFIDTDEFIGLFARPASMALTHTRTPTSGGLGDEQAQPFVQAGTAAVHNGWIMNTKELKQKWGITKPSGVDSELIVSFLARKGPHKLADFLESADGMSAVAAIHNDKMYLIRSGNPTYYCRLIIGEGECVTVFGSEGEAVKSALAHTWLLPQSYTIQGTQQNILLEAQAHKLQPISRKIRSFSYNCYGLDDDYGYIKRLVDHR